MVVGIKGASSLCSPVIVLRGRLTTEDSLASPSRSRITPAHLLLLNLSELYPPSLIRHSFFPCRHRNCEHRFPRRRNAEHLLGEPVVFWPSGCQQDVSTRGCYLDQREDIEYIIILGMRGNNGGGVQDSSAAGLEARFRRRKPADLFDQHRFYHMGSGLNVTRFS